jgi:hypothetical protein
LFTLGLACGRQVKPKGLSSCFSRRLPFIVRILIWNPVPNLELLVALDALRLLCRSAALLRPSRRFASYVVIPRRSRGICCFSSAPSNGSAFALAVPEPGLAAPKCTKSTRTKRRRCIPRGKGLSSIKSVPRTGTARRHVGRNLFRAQPPGAASDGGTQKP